MAKKNILIKKRNGTTWDELYPITTANNIKTSDGSSVEAHLADFANRGLTAKAKLATGDWDNYIDTGFYNGYDLAHTPFAGWCYVEVVAHTHGNYVMQIATPLNTDVARYYRLNIGSAWGVWRKILDQRDYDQVNTALNAKVNKAGDTMTGILTAQSNTSYTVRQVHNMILSLNDADMNQMQNGDIWIKYK